LSHTLIIAFAIILAGGLIAGAIIYVDQRNQPEVIETNNPEGAFDLAMSGYKCEAPIEPDGGYAPISIEMLSDLTGNAINPYPGPFRCTAPS
jgi:hypothetical protein